MGIEWKKGRHALLWSPDGWEEAIAVVDDDCGDAFRGWEPTNVAAESVQHEFARLALLPGQCRECYCQNGRHSKICVLGDRVRTNRRAGVPDFLLEWAMTSSPTVMDDDFRLYGIDRDSKDLIELRWVYEEDCGWWEEPRGSRSLNVKAGATTQLLLGFVAMNRRGLTLTPWNRR